MLLLDAPRPPSCGWRRPLRCATVCRASPSFGWSATAAPPFLLPQVHVAATGAQAEALLARHVCAQEAPTPPALVLGFDTESRPMGLGGTGRLALLQLATPTAVVLLPLLRFEKTPPSLARLLSSPALLCGVSSHDDADAIAAAARAAPMCAVAVDIATAAARHRVAGELGGERVGLAALVAALGGPALAKPRQVTLSNWEKWPLTAAQVSYAALDAFASGWAAAALHARLAERPGGLPPLTDWLREEAVTQAAERAAAAARRKLVRDTLLSAAAQRPAGQRRQELLAAAQAALPGEPEAYINNTVTKLIKQGRLVSDPASYGVRPTAATRARS